MEQCRHPQGALHRAPAAAAVQRLDHAGAAGLPTPLQPHSAEFPSCGFVPDVLVAGARLEGSVQQHSQRQVFHCELSFGALVPLERAWGFLVTAPKLVHEPTLRTGCLCIGARRAMQPEAGAASSAHRLRTFLAAWSTCVGARTMKHVSLCEDVCIKNTRAWHVWMQLLRQQGSRRHLVSTCLTTRSSASASGRAVGTSISSRQTSPS